MYRDVSAGGALTGYVVVGPTPAGFALLQSSNDGMCTAFGTVAVPSGSPIGVSLVFDHQMIVAVSPSAYGNSGGE